MLQQTRIRQWKGRYFDLHFIESCSQQPNWQLDSIGSDNGWVPNRGQAIILTNDGLVYWRI